VTINRVFVLCTGRCGSRTLWRALQHVDGWTVGHESRAHYVEDRLRYPEHHIEVDNRLSFFLGSLARLYDGPNTLWVHLRRDPEAVAQSLLRTSWGTRQGVMSAWAGRIVRWPAGRVDRTGLASLAVEATEANIAEFLRDRNPVRIQIEEPRFGFAELWDRAGFTGDWEAARAEVQRKWTDGGVAL
jgi:hypothetical protein